MVGTPHTPFEMGTYAYRLGHPLDSNPFQRKTSPLDWDNWNIGWKLAEAEEDMMLWAFGLEFT